jgi:hypothetical protein
MADIRVFDAGGFPVPFMIRPVPGRIVEPPPVELPFFPWTEPGAAFPEGADIVIDARGTVLSIKNQGPGPAEAAAAYLLDLSALPSDPSMLNVSLGAEGDIYNAAARIYASADLSRWEELGRPQTLACFGAGGAGRETLELPPGAGRRYLLLKLDRPGLSPRRIRAVFDKFEIPAPPGEKTIDGTWGEDRRSVRYDTGGFYPLRLIDFPLPRPDSVEVLVKYRFTAEEDWREAQRTILFRVNDGSGGTLSGGALETGVSAPLWELEAAGPFPSIPGCTIRWTPQELVFLGRGPGPWTLAWGNGDYDSPGGFPGSLGPNLEDAGIGEARPLGPPRYEARPPPPARKNWEPFILWGVLVIAVLVLSAMAFYIAASMRKEKL